MYINGIDEKDNEIINLLLKDARMSYSDIGEKVGLSRTAVKNRVAVLEKNAVASKETVNSYYSKANTLATMSAGKYESFRAALDTLGLYAHPVSKMAEGTNRLGAVEGTKEIARWAFEAEKGDVSTIFTINNNYAFFWCFNFCGDVA